MLQSGDRRPDVQRPRGREARGLGEDDRRGPNLPGARLRLRAPGRQGHVRLGAAAGLGRVLRLERAGVARLRAHDEQEELQVCHCSLEVR